MKITIFGTGYVGLVTGACFAEVGNQVLCVDVDEKKIARLNRGEIPIFEPGLESYVISNQRAKRLSFTTDAQAAVDHSQIIFIAVGTPPDEDGAADLSHVLEVADTVGRHMSEHKIIVDKSTVPVGTADKVREQVLKAQHSRGVEIPFDVASNPEFLKEGAALDDFMKPDRVIIGTDSEQVEQRLHSLYAPFTRNRDRFMVMGVRSAELTKYAANAMLATKISFMNEISNIAQCLGADIEDVRKGIGSDPRIGYQFIYPGAGYGGSCFPKDVKALANTARDIGYRAELIESVEAVNKRQKQVLFDKISTHYGGQLEGKTIALWGLAFKPKTDDIREAPSLVLMESLWGAGARVKAHDPQAMAAAQNAYGVSDRLILCGTPEEAIKDADCLVVITEWNLFRSPDFAQIKQLLKDPVIFDGRNVYSPQDMQEHGFTYYGIGRQVIG